MEVVARAFSPQDLVAGHPALDFVNTVTARNTAAPLDWLDSYARLLEWAALAGAVDSSALARLRRLASASSQGAARALARAKRLREAMHEVFSALIGRRTIPSDALDALEAGWKQALQRTRLAAAHRSVEPALDAERSGLDLIVDRLALEAVDLLRTFPEERARICLGSQCGWLFIDTSKAGRRVWCDMATCGNAAKSRRHYERRRRG